jgi:hypothetical protein
MRVDKKIPPGNWSQKQQRHASRALLFPSTLHPEKPLYRLALNEFHSHNTQDKKAVRETNGLMLRCKRLYQFKMNAA